MQLTKQDKKDLAKLDVAIAYLEKIPRKEWSDCRQYDSQGRYCFIGHFGRKGAPMKHRVNRYKHSVRSSWVERINYISYRMLGFSMTSANDDISNISPLKTPKGRVLNALRKMNISWKQSI